MRRLLLYGFGMLVLLAGCRWHKTASPETPEVRDTVPVVVVEPELPVAYVPPVRQWLSVRGVAHFDMPGMGGLDLNLFAVVRKDSVVYLHVSKFGLELGRALCRPESVVVLLHVESSYWKGGYSQIRQKTGLPVDFQTLQDLLLISPVNAQTVVDSNGFLAKASWLKQDGSVYLKVGYKEYANIGDSTEVLYPRSISISIPSMGSGRMTVKSAKVEVPGPASLKIPEKYKRMEW